VPVLVLSMHDEWVYGERAIRAGARVFEQTGGEQEGGGGHPHDPRGIQYTMKEA
jgi:hypothetical protein